MSVHICSFSGAASDIKPKDRNLETLVSVLKKSPKLSVWDMDKKWLRDMIHEAIKQGLVTETESEYPWYKFEVKS